MRIQQNIGEVKKIYGIEVKLQQWVYVSTKWLSLDVRIQHRILDALKHLLPTLV